MLALKILFELLMINIMSENFVKVAEIKDIGPSSMKGS
jgi:hypothetical protein